MRGAQNRRISRKAAGVQGGEPSAEVKGEEPLQESEGSALSSEA